MTAFPTDLEPQEELVLPLDDLDFYPEGWQEPRCELCGGPMRFTEFGEYECFENCDGPAPEEVALAPADPDETFDPEAIQSLLTSAVAGLFGPDVDADEALTFSRSAVDLVFHALPVAGLEIAYQGRVAELKMGLADWVRDYDEACMNGGLATETDIEALAERSRRLLEPR